MSDQELHLLEEKVEGLIKYCNNVRSERNELLKQTQEQSSQLREFEEKLTQMEDEREKVRLRVSTLIEKIGQIEVLPEEPEGSTDMDPQSIISSAT
ncbi:MAG: cell division protein ZapB [Nitrospiraceae bacterium]|nr:cell division protein ZapB [Nitrospiraceae bacterium]